MLTCGKPLLVHDYSRCNWTKYDPAAKKAHREATFGTLLVAFCAGPIMQLAFRTVSFDATAVRHQKLPESFRILSGRK